MSGSVSVELDIFSGMPNPSWNLSDEDSAVLHTLVAGLAPTAGRTLHNDLGYRGFVVALSDDDGVALLRVQEGIVEVGRAGSLQFLDDPGRLVERFLLGTGRPLLSPEVRSAVTASLS